MFPVRTFWGGLSGNKVLDKVVETFDCVVRPTFLNLTEVRHASDRFPNASHASVTQFVTPLWPLTVFSVHLCRVCIRQLVVCPWQSLSRRTMVWSEKPMDRALVSARWVLAKKNNQCYSWRKAAEVILLEVELKCCYVVWNNVTVVTSLKLWALISENKNQKALLHRGKDFIP